MKEEVSCGCSALAPYSVSGFATKPYGAKTVMMSIDMRSSGYAPFT